MEWTPAAPNVANGFSNEIASTILYCVIYILVGVLMMVVVVIAGLFFVMWVMQSCAADMARLSH